MVMVGVDSGSLQADSQPKSFGLVWGSAAAWCHSTFINWTGWTLAMALPWWQHHKHCHLYYYYLTALLQHHQPTRSLHSSSSHQLFIPQCNLSFGSRAFHFSAPQIWNSLSLGIRESQSLPALKLHLKTHFYQSAYPAPLQISNGTDNNLPYANRRSLSWSPKVSHKRSDTRMPSTVRHDPCNTCNHQHHEQWLLTHQRQWIMQTYMQKSTTSFHTQRQLKTTANHVLDN